MDDFVRDDHFLLEPCHDPAPASTQLQPSPTVLSPPPHRTHQSHQPQQPQQQHPFPAALSFLPPSFVPYQDSSAHTVVSAPDVPAVAAVVTGPGVPASLPQLNVPSAVSSQHSHSHSHSHPHSHSLPPRHSPRPPVCSTDAAAPMGAQGLCIRVPISNGCASGASPRDSASTGLSPALVGLGLGCGGAATCTQSAHPGSRQGSNSLKRSSPSCSSSPTHSSSRPTASPPTISGTPHGLTQRLAHCKHTCHHCQCASQ